MEELQDYQKQYLEPRPVSSYDPDKPSAYLIEGSAGTYDMYQTFPVCIKIRLEDAVEFVTKHELWKNKVESIAIGVKDINKHWSEDDSPQEFYNLREAFNEFIWKSVAPNATDESDLSEEQWEKMDEMVNDNDTFKKFLMSKGYSEEVSEASIAYHDNELSDFNTTYRIYKINIE